MANDPADLERALRSDLQAVDQNRLGDHDFCGQLYRALANNSWSRAGDTTLVALSWGRAEALVNDLRDTIGAGPLTLAQTGGEGWISDAARDELGRLGWSARTPDSGAGSELHRGAEAASPPPRDAGGRLAREWEDEAHADAEVERSRTLGT